MHNRWKAKNIASLLTFKTLTFFTLIKNDKYYFIAIIFSLLSVKIIFIGFRKYNREYQTFTLSWSVIMPVQSIACTAEIIWINKFLDYHPGNSHSH